MSKSRETILGLSREQMDKALQIPQVLGSTAFEAALPTRAEGWRTRNLFDRPGWVGNAYLVRDFVRYALPQLPAIIRELHNDPEGIESTPLGQLTLAPSLAVHAAPHNNVVYLEPATEPAPIAA